MGLLNRQTHCRSSAGIGFLKKIVLVIAFVGAGQLLGQQLELFEQTESERDIREVAGSGPSVRDRDGNIVTGPQFTLIGTSRIGSNYFVVLKDSSGEFISMSSPANQPREIPGYPGYRVVSIGSADASIAYPDGIPCVGYSEQGVMCESDRQAKISLTNAEPLELSQSETGARREQLLSEDTGSADASANPFEAILQRAANEGAGRSTEAFEPTRIDPSDVPPGMRIVSTPFGDRLVEEDC